MALKAASHLVCEVLLRELRLLTKQIDMLAQLAETSPVVRQRVDSKTEHPTDIEISLLPKDRLEPLLERIKEQVSQVRIGIEELAEPGSHSWAKWEIVGEDQNLG